MERKTLVGGPRCGDFVMSAPGYSPEQIILPHILPEEMWAPSGPPPGTRPRKVLRAIYRLHDGHYLYRESYDDEQGDAG